MRFMNRTRWAYAGKVLLLSSLLLVFVQGGTVESQAGVLDNPGFEMPLQGGGIPGWQSYGAGQAGVSWSLSQTDAHSGDHSLRLSDDSATAAIGMESEPFPVTAGASYSASAMLKVESGRLAVLLRFFDQAGNKVKDAAVWARPENGQWVFRNASAIAPDDAVAGTVLLYSAGPDKAEGYFDDVGVAEIAVGTFANKGQPLMNLINQDSLIGKEAGRDVVYMVIKGANNSTFFAVVDLLTAETIRTIEMPGVNGSYAIEEMNGAVYVGTQYNGHLYKYMPGSASLTDLGALGGESHIYDMVAGNNGKLYMGTYPNAHVFEYDTVAEQLRDLGRVHPTEKYVRSLAFDADRNVLYAGVGGVEAGIVKLNLADGSKQEILHALLPDAYANYQMAQGMGYGLGKLFVNLNRPDHLLVVDTATNTVEYFNPNGGIGLGSRDVVVMPGDNENVYFGGYVLRKYNVATQTFSLAYPDPGQRLFNFQDAVFIQRNDPEWPGTTLAATGEKGKMLFFNPANGKTDTVKVEDTGAPVLIQSLHTGFDGQVYIGGYLGASGFSWYNPDDGTFAEMQEFGQAESMASVNDRIYFGTYGNARIHEYDPTKPWDGKTNPRRVADLLSHGQDRPFAMVGVDALNKLFMGSVANYNSLQGALTVYDPASQHVQVHRNIVHNQGVVSLVYHDGLIYGGTSVYGGLGTSGPSESAGKLFIYDPVTNTKLFELAPFADRKVVSGLLAGPDGLIWGVAEDYLFKFDPHTREIVYQEIRFGRYGAGKTVWTDAFLKTGMDGYVYGTNIQKKFFRVDPSTMEYVVIKEQAGRYLTDDHDGNLYMSNNADFWVYTLPADESTIGRLLESAFEKGRLPASVKQPLANALRQAVHHHDKGHKEQAIKHLRDFLKRLHLDAFGEPADAQWRLPLERQAETLLAKWERP